MNVPLLDPTPVPLAFFAAGSTLLFQGDSITDTGRDHTDLGPGALGQGYVYLLATTIGLQSPQRPLIFLNRGINGDRIVDLATRWRRDTLVLRPQLLSILVGVNEMICDPDRYLTPPEFEAAYDRLLASTKAELPGTKIVLGEPFLLPAGNRKPRYAALMDEMKLRQAAVRRLAEKHRAALVRYQAAFDSACAHAPAESWGGDGIHPTPAGHALMAREWLRAVDAFWHAP